MRIMEPTKPTNDPAAPPVGGPVVPPVGQTPPVPAAPLNEMPASPSGQGGPTTSVPPVAPQAPVVDPNAGQQPGGGTVPPATPGV